MQPPLLGVEADWQQALLHQVHLQVVLQHRVYTVCRMELHLEVTTNTWQVVLGLHPSPLQRLSVSHTGQLGKDMTSSSSCCIEPSPAPPAAAVGS